MSYVFAPWESIAWLKGGFSKPQQRGQNFWVVDPITLQHRKIRMRNPTSPPLPSILPLLLPNPTAPLLPTDPTPTPSALRKAEITIAKAMCFERIPSSTRRLNNWMSF